MLGSVSALTKFRRKMNAKSLVLQTSSRSIGSSVFALYSMHTHLLTEPVSLYLVNTWLPVRGSALRLTIALEFFLLFLYARILYVYYLACSNKIITYVCGVAL